MMLLLLKIYLLARKSTDMLVCSQNQYYIHVGIKIGLVWPNFE